MKKLILLIGIACSLSAVESDGDNSQEVWEKWSFDWPYLNLCTKQLFLSGYTRILCMQFNLPTDYFKKNCGEKVYNKKLETNESL